LPYLQKLLTGLWRVVAYFLIRRRSDHADREHEAAQDDEPGTDGATTVDALRAGRP
jgi:hypothetical protein